MMTLHRFPDRLAGLPLLCGLVLLLGSRGDSRAVAPARDAADALERVRSALALERAGDSVAAREIFLGAVPDLPPIADWLRLRAATLTRDSMGRRALYAQIQTPMVSAQVPRTEAAIREGLGDIDGAIQARLLLGEFQEAVRIRLRVAPDAAARKPALRDGLTLLNAATGITVVRLVALLAPYATELAPEDQLLLARRAGAEKSPLTIELFSRAATSGARLTELDRLYWGRSLFDHGKYLASAVQFERIIHAPLVNQGRYERGRALVRAGRASEGRLLLERLVAMAPGDSASGAASLLLGDLRRDAGDYSGARHHWLNAARTAPPASGAPRAGFLAALVLWQQQDYRGAAGEWDSLRNAHPQSDEGIAAAYWEGRAWSKLGQSARARELWEGVLRTSSLSYYSGLALEQLGRPRPEFASQFDSVPPLPDLVAVGERLSLLQQGTLNREASLEQQWIFTRAGESPERVIAAGRLLAGSGATWTSTQLGWRAWRRTGPDAGSLRLIFPLRYTAPMTGAALEAGVDPALVAALVRQESVFDSAALSRAGARGLMQL
ncbi:MAG: tetratricopeptide repeat protein, partial [Gemmatimonadota bacterium]